VVAKNGNEDHGKIHKCQIPDTLESLGDYRPQGRVNAGHQGTQSGYGNDPILDGGNGTRRSAPHVSRQPEPSQYRGALLAKKLERKIDDTLSKALTLIDPAGTLVPGSRQHNRISSLIREWIDQCGPEYALCMAKDGSEHLDRWRKFL
jgi:hypothetical protein